jgi:OPT oligopeptide transporter protein
MIWPERFPMPRLSTLCISRGQLLRGAWWYLPSAPLHLCLHRLSLLQPVHKFFPCLGDIFLLTIRVMLYFFPSYVFIALSYFSRVGWIVPNKVKINQLFAVAHGLGLALMTFDWGQVSYVGSPCLPMVGHCYHRLHRRFLLSVSRPCSL